MKSRGERTSPSSATRSSISISSPVILWMRLICSSLRKSSHADFASPSGSGIEECLRARIREEKQLPPIQPEHFGETRDDFVRRMSLGRFEVADVRSRGLDATRHLFLGEVQLPTTIAKYLTKTAFLGPCHECCPLRFLRGAGSTAFPNQLGEIRRCQFVPSKSL